MGYFDWPVRWLSPSDFPSYDIQNMASIHVQNIWKQEFYCLSVITYLECIKITFKNFQNHNCHKHNQTYMQNVTLALANLFIMCPSYKS